MEWIWTCTSTEGRCEKKKDKFKQIILPIRKFLKFQQAEGDNLKAFRPKQQTG